MSARFSQDVALVTGAGHGIGLALADGLLVAGADVIALDMDAQRLAALSERRPEVITHRCDLATVDPYQLAAELLSLVEQPVNLIVHNVGITASQRFLALEPEAFDRTFAANLRTPWFLTRRLVEPLIETKRRGSILFVSSLHSRFVRMEPDYSASKAAVVMLVREMAHELGPKGVRVNVISPGAIDTWSDTAPMSSEHRARAEGSIPLRRFGEASDVAPIALALLDDAVSGYLTGADVVVDGGLSGHNWLHSLPATWESQH